jgi:hypothetical protein
MQRIVDELLHSIIPFYFILFWFLYENKKDVSWKSILSWLIYPAVYLVFILFRGNSSGFYPYPFVNVIELGIGEVVVNSGLLVLVFTLTALAFVGIGKLISKVSNNTKQD